MPEHALHIPYCDPIEAFAPFRDIPMSMLLHGVGAAARWSYVLTAPTETLTRTSNIMADMRARLGPRREPSGPAPFNGGLAGFFSYEFGALFEPAMPQDVSPRLPRAAVGAYDCVAVFDNVESQAYIVGDTPSKAAALASRLGAETVAPSVSRGEIEAEHGAGHYCAHVRALLQRIRAGDIFQANISRLYRGQLGQDDHPYILFARLCRQSPAPYCAYLRLEDAAIVSNSPERLASVRRSGEDLIAAASPIKGTRPRGVNDAEDQRLAAELLASEKDKAENLMIVDLMRNDFSRVSAPGSVRAPELFALASYANVHHLVSTIEARLQTGLDAIDLFGAVSPAGSITGAPKIKAMELIHAVEQIPRAANYGAMAWFGRDGAMDANVLIRTATCYARADGWEVEFRVGGGITIGSDPDEEARETEIKALSLIRAIRNQNS